jgi:hypothetical protein
LKGAKKMIQTIPKGKDYIVGISLGSTSNDWTALVIVECVETDGHMEYQVVNITRFPIGSTFVDISNKLKLIWNKLRGEKEPYNSRTVAVDVTGASEAVVNLIADSIDIDYEVTITQCAAATRDEKRRQRWSVPKKDLIGALMLVYQAKQFRIADSLQDAETLAREAEKYTQSSNIKISESSDELWREGADDDLLLAWAVMMWAIGKREPSVCIPMPKQEVWNPYDQAMNPYMRR